MTFIVLDVKMPGCLYSHVVWISCILSLTKLLTGFAACTSLNLHCEWQRPNLWCGLIMYTPPEMACCSDYSVFCVFLMSIIYVYIYICHAFFLLYYSFLLFLSCLFFCVVFSTLSVFSWVDLTPVNIVMCVLCVYCGDKINV